MTVIDLTARRIERLEKRLVRVEDSLGQIVTVLDVHTRHFERMEDALVGIASGVDRMTERFDRTTDRIDRLTNAIARGRTQDLVRWSKVERRLTSVESRSRRKPKRR